MEVCAMKQLLRCLFLLLIGTVMVSGVAGCKKANPDDPETQALAKQFIEAVYVNHDSSQAMSLVVPITNYGYVSAKIIDETIAAETKKKCSTPVESVSPGRPGDDVTIPELSEADAAKGITARAAWAVASKYLCAGQSTTADRSSLLMLEKVNGKWGVAKVSWETGVGESHPFGLN
jgi:hypothetical protein